MPAPKPFAPELSNLRIQTRDKLVETALAMLEQGWIPSITELAAACGVSRATAYRYFPSQASLVNAIVDGSLGPVLRWQPRADSPKGRLDELLDFAYPQMQKHEGALRAALQVSLKQWADARAERASDEPRYLRGNRKKLLALAVAPLDGTVPLAALERLKQALSLLYGTETLIVLGDIWGLDLDQIQSVAKWMGAALIDATVREEGPARFREGGGQGRDGAVQSG